MWSFPRISTTNLNENIQVNFFKVLRNTKNVNDLGMRESLKPFGLDKTERSLPLSSPGIFDGHDGNIKNTCIITYIGLGTGNDRRPLRRSSYDLPKCKAQRR